MTTVEVDGSGLAGPVSLMDPELVRDPFGTYARIREQAPLARGVIPGLAPLWLVTRYDDVRAVMNDRRFVVNAADVPGNEAPNMMEQIRLAMGIPPEYVRYLRSGLSDADGEDHLRLRRLVSRAFTVRRVTELRPRIEELAESLLDRLPDVAEEGVVDLLEHFAYPLPIAVICELVGIAEGDRAQWRAWSAALVAGAAPGMGDAVCGMVDDVFRLIARRRAEPADDLISDLVAAQSDGDRLTDDELATLVVTLVLAGHETTVNLIANGTAALLTHPEQLALLQRDPALMPRAVHELMRWCGPALGTLIRYATEDVTVAGMVVRRGEAVLPVLAAANHDPRAFAEPTRLDVTRDPERRRETHVGFGHGPHYCLGAALARQECEVALAALLRRFPALALDGERGDLVRGPNPGTWHLAALPVRLT